MAAANFPMVNTSRYYCLHENTEYQPIPQKLWDNTIERKVVFNDDLYAEIKLDPTYHQGYYQDICLDFVLVVLIFEKTSLEGIYKGCYSLDEYEYDELNLIAQNYTQTVADRICKEVLQMKAEAEKHFAQVCDYQLERMGAFSNGSTLYKRIN